MEEGLAACEKLGISSLTPLGAVLRRQELRDKLTRAYGEQLPIKVVLETVFPAALYSLANGDARGIRYQRAGSP